MAGCSWEVIESFFSPDEYRRFVVWINNQVVNGRAESVRVLDSYAGPGFDEFWFKCCDSAEVWRLVAPEPPFRGYWGPVATKENNRTEDNGTDHV